MFGEERLVLFLHLLSFVLLLLASLLCIVLVIKETLSRPLSVCEANFWFTLA